MKKNILEEKTKSLGKRFIGMEKRMVNLDGRNVMATKMDIDFYSNLPIYKWVVFGSPVDSDIEKQTIKVAKRNTEDYVYFVFSFDPNIDFLQLIEHITTIIDVNTEVEKKTMLSSDKMSELQTLIKELTYDELKTLTFNYKKKRKINKKNNVKEIVETNASIQPVSTSIEVLNAPSTPLPANRAKLKEQIKKQIEPPKLDHLPDFTNISDDDILNNSIN